MREIYYLRDSDDLRSLVHEECGLAAAINLPVASEKVFDCLVLQEHRGEKASGIISVNKGNFKQRRRIGSVTKQFDGINFKALLPGKTAIGHGRYATQGDPGSPINVQPLLVQTKYGQIAIAHNGTLIDHKKLKGNLLKEGSCFQSTTDSEIFAHLIARSSKDNLAEAIIETVQRVSCTYSLLIMSKDKLFALRDQFGVRPLSIAKLDNGYLVCSENYTFDQYDEAVFIRDIEPAEIITFEKNKTGFESFHYAKVDERFCIFEGIYFSSPRTVYKGFYHEDFRQKLGELIFKENPGLQGDYIVPILDSGKHSALGLSKASGIPYKEYFLRIHNPPRSSSRSFTSPNKEERERAVYQKLHLRLDKIKGKRIIIVDDSIVRATTMRIIIERLRMAGAKEIIVCISAPPIVNICPNGMDYQNHSELVAYKNSIDQIRDIIKANWLIYVSLNGLRKVVSETYGCGICDGCFGGIYPVSC
jgi:amidophosphoribosyltransferase